MNVRRMERPLRQLAVVRTMGLGHGRQRRTQVTLVPPAARSRVIAVTVRDEDNNPAVSFRMSIPADSPLARVDGALHRAVMLEFTWSSYRPWVASDGVMPLQMAKVLVDVLEPGLDEKGRLRFGARFFAPSELLQDPEMPGRASRRWLEPFMALLVGDGRVLDGSIVHYGRLMDPPGTEYLPEPEDAR